MSWTSTLALTGASVKLRRCRIRTQSTNAIRWTTNSCLLDTAPVGRRRPQCSTHAFLETVHVLCVPKQVFISTLWHHDVKVTRRCQSFEAYPANSSQCPMESNMLLLKIKWAIVMMVQCEARLTPVLPFLRFRDFVRTLQCFSADSNSLMRYVI